MPFEDILEFLGAGSLLLIVIVPFWKADDAISETLRKDISGWLIRSNVPLPHRPWLTVIKVIFANFFGKNHISRRCVLISYLVSISASVMIFFTFVTWLDTFLAPSLAQFGWPSGAQLIILMYMILLINPIADFINLFISRKVISWLAEVPSGFPVVGLMALISAFPFIVATTVLWLGLVMIEVYFGDVNTDFPGLNVALGGLISGSGAMLTYGVAFTLVLTTFVTTFWVWSALLGVFIVRLMSLSRTIYAYLTYALPIDDRPIRSIGLFFTLLVGSVLSVSAIAKHVFSFF